MLISEAINEFIKSKTADGVSAQTVKWYESVLGQFRNAWGESDVEAPTRRDMRQYVVDLAERTERYTDAKQKPSQSGGLSKASVEAHKRALNAFWNWAMEEYDLDTSPMAGIKKAKRINAHPKSISIDTLRALLLEAKNQNDTLARRDIAILYLFADTGMRASGLCGLHLNELNLRDKKVIVLEKGMKRRAIPFTDATRLELIRWLMVRPENATTLFCGFQPNREGEPLTVSGINQILKRLAKNAHVKETVSPHRIRHMFAREYLNRGGDLATLSRLMGHDTTEITSSFYAVYTQEETSDKHEKFSPINSLLD